jgi:hypothetical protein
MPSAIDQRRLRDGAAALLASQDLREITLTPMLADRLLTLSNQLSDALCAMQSLDDLESREANEDAWNGMLEIQRRSERVDQAMARRGTEGLTS